MTTILVLGGTKPSQSIVDRLCDHDLDPMVSVTRSSSLRLYPDVPENKIQVGCLNEDDLKEFIEQNGIETIIDATHPYAAEISENAISLANKSDRDYLYYDRPSDLPESHDQLHRVRGWDKAVEETTEYGTVFLTIGVNHLDRFVDRSGPGQFIVRVLPRESSKESALQAGFQNDQIVSSWPPDSSEQERSFIEEHDIELLVTKDSGEPGGVPHKWQAVKDSKIEMLVRERPTFNVPNCKNDIERVVEWGLSHA